MSESKTESGAGVTFTDTEVDGMYNGLKHAAEGITCGDFVDKQDIKHATTDMQTLDAYKVLMENGIQSAPVLDKATGKWVGFIDMGDIAAHLCHVYTASGVTGDDMATAFTDLRNLLARTSLTLPKPTLEVMNISKTNPWVPVSETDPLYKAMEILCSVPAEGGSVHRVPVMKADGSLAGIITQSKVVAFLADNMVKLGPIVEQELSECAVKDMISATEDEPLLRALAKLVDRRVTGLPILSKDPPHRVVGVLSTSDVRLAHAAEARGLIGVNVIEFVQAVRLAKDRSRKDGMTMATVFAIGTTDTYAHAIRKLAALKVHRLYIEGEDGALAGVVSLKDIISRLVLGRRTTSATH